MSKGDGNEGGGYNDAIRREKKKIEAHLLSAVLFVCKLHLAHASSTNGLSEDPFARLGRNGGSRCPLLRTGGTGISGSLHDRRHSSRAVGVGSSSHVAVVRGAVGAGASTAMDTFRVGSSGDRGRAVFA